MASGTMSKGKSWVTLFSGNQLVSSSHDFSISNLQGYNFLSIRGYQTSNSGGKRFCLTISDCEATGFEYNYCAFGDIGAINVKALFTNDKVKITGVQSEIYITKIKGLM